MSNGLTKYKGLYGVLGTAAARLVIVFAVLMSGIVAASAHVADSAYAARVGDKISTALPFLPASPHAKLGGMPSTGAVASANFAGAGFAGVNFTGAELAEYLAENTENSAGHFAIGYFEFGQVGTTPLANQTAQLIALSGCHFLRLPDSPNQKHCEHVVKRATYSSRLKLLRRIRSDVNFFVTPTVWHNQTVGLYGTSPMAIRANSARPRSPFKAMYAVTSRMLN